MPFDEKKFRASLPQEMLIEKRFVRYFLKPKPEGGTAKIPLGNHSDPNTWSTLDEAVKQLENKDQGIGYCFLGGNIHGLDLDHCRNPRNGQICNEAMVLLSRIPSWAEYSVSGQGIHVFFKGNVRGKQLGETCLQYWNPKNSPRFYALTCDIVGAAFTTIKDVGDEFNYIFATARHISAKIREELKDIDYEQWKALPDERVEHEATREKAKAKTRKLHKDFNLEDYLKFYGLQVDNVANNDIGKCYRLSTCPIKGERHVGQNGTTTNFILSADGGLGFHCQSTGCVDYSVAQVIAKLEAERPYPYHIYVKDESGSTGRHVETVLRASRLVPVEEIDEKHRIWLWPGYLEANKLVHFAGASSEGKSPVTLDLISRLTSGSVWPDGVENPIGPRSAILLAGEDDWADTIKPRLKLAGANLNLVFRFISTIKRGEEEHDVSTALDRDIEEIVKQIKSRDDVGLIVIDPITNYLGSKSMNKEDEMRGGILMPLATLAQTFNVCVVTVGHLNKRDKDTSVLQRLMGAAAFGGVARQVFVFGNDPEDDDKFAHVMGMARNTAAPALKYRTEAIDVEWDGQKSEVVRVKWGGPAKQVDMDEVVNPLKQVDKSKSREASAFIKAFLLDGAKTTKAIEDALKDAGMEYANFARAAKKVAKTRKQKGSKISSWEWYLPTTEQIEFDK